MPKKKSDLSIQSKQQRYKSLLETVPCGIEEIFNKRFSESY